MGGNFERDVFKFLGVIISAAVAVRIITNADKVGSGSAKFLGSINSITQTIAGR